MPEARITPDEAEQIRSGYLPPSAVGKVGPATRRYFGLDEVSPDVAVGVLTARERIAAGDLSDACFCMGGVGPHPYHGTPR